VDSLRFHYRIWNESLENPKGKVLLVHGFAGSTFSWRENTDTLSSSGYLVVAVDLPGVGYSERNPKVNQSQSNRAVLLWKFLNAIDMGETLSWNLVGHSLGGGTVEAMALINPGMTKSILIVDGMVFKKNSNMKGAFVTLSRNKQYNKIFSSLVEKNIFTYDMIKRLLKKNYGYDPDSAIINGYLEPLMMPGTAEAVMTIWSNSKEVMQLDVKNLEKIPVRVIWGGEDRTIYPRTGRRFVRAVPEAELVIIHGAHHDPMETHPKVFNELMISFLNFTNSK
jgi:pimeloyl-ACP methyl ester carboxylesterase